MVLFCGGCLPRASSSSHRRRRRQRSSDGQLWLLEEPTTSNSNSNNSNCTSASAAAAAAAATKISSSSRAATVVVGPPSYRMVASRSSCPLLEACWNQDWSTVLRRLASHPHEAFVQTRHNRRTALHLCTMPGAACPDFILEALVQVNPHTLLVHDAHQHGGTPLHFVCGSNHRNNPTIVQCFVDAALQVEQLYYSRDGSWNLPFNAYNGYSPLYMACKKLAPASTLQILVDSRRRRGISHIGNPSHYCRVHHHHTGTGSTNFANAAPVCSSVPTWIAPWTGGESVDDAEGQYHHNLFRSPLQELWVGVRAQLVGLEHDNEFTWHQRLRQSTPDPWWSSTDTDLTGVVGVVDPAAPWSGSIEAWYQCCVLLRPHVSSPDCIVHAVANLKSPIPELFDLVCRLYPHQLVQPDQNGRIPLHLILLRYRDGGDGSRFANDSTYEEAHVRLALFARPDCAEIMEPHEGLPPAALAAARGSSLSVVFALVRAYPLVVVASDAKEREPQRHGTESSSRPP